MAHLDQSQMLDILLLVAVVDPDLLVLRQPIGGGGAGGGFADGSPGTANTGSGKKVKMASVLDTVVVEPEDSFKNSPKLSPVEYTRLQLVLVEQQNPNQGAGADGIVIIRYQ